MKKLLAIGVAGAVVCGGSATAEPMRTFLVQDKMVPAKGTFEIGGTFGYQEITDRDSSLADANIGFLAPYLRYGVSKEFSLMAEIPFVRADLWDTTENGIGDVRLGADLVGFQDALGYAFVMPYARVSLPSGDEDKGLGAGETQGKFGIIVGTTVDDDWDFIVDGGFVGRDELSNSFQIGGAVVYKFNKTFSLHAEGLVEHFDESGIETTKTLLGGLIYRPAEYWMIGLYGGTQRGDIDDNVVLGAKLAYWYE